MALLQNKAFGAGVEKLSKKNYGEGLRPSQKTDMDTTGTITFRIWAHLNFNHRNEICFSHLISHGDYFKNFIGVAKISLKIAQGVVMSACGCGPAFL